jgi:hypothetical protein
MFDNNLDPYIKNNQNIYSLICQKIYDNTPYILL